VTGTVFATIGPAGAGKSTLRRRIWPDLPYVSLDENRRVLSSCRCTSNQEETARALEMGVSFTRSILAAGGSVWWDATNTDRSRRMLLQVLAAEYQARTVAYVVLPSLLVTLARNRTRDPRLCPCCGYARRVPEQEVWRMHREAVAALPTLHAEGWNEIHHVELPRYPTEGSATA
jgi:predicted kinase